MKTIFPELKVICKQYEKFRKFSYAHMRRDLTQFINYYLKTINILLQTKIQFMFEGKFVTFVTFVI